jgi:hypothetical protein
MTRKSFYRKLRKIAPAFNWKIVADGSIRGTDKNANPLLHPRRACHCPVTAVVLATKKRNFPIYDYEAAAPLIGIDGKTANQIADAADDQRASGREGSLRKHVRKALLRAVGL